MKSGQRVVVVSGGAAGIGRRIAATFREAGDLVHVFDRSESAVQELRQAHPEITAHVADASRVADVDRVFDAVASAHGRLDVLANNVGVSGPTAPVESIDPAAWDETIAVDLSSHFYCTRRAVPLLKATGGGSIVNIASNAALFGFPLGHYAIQWARQSGAFVVATASNDADRQSCLAAGAQVVVNHRADGWAKDVLAATGGERIDRAVDVEFGANLPKLLDSEEAKRAAILDLDRALREGRLQHRIAEVLPLRDIARSHELIERGAVRGAVVVSL